MIERTTYICLHKRPEITKQSTEKIIDNDDYEIGTMERTGRSKWKMPINPV